MVNFAGPGTIDATGCDIGDYITKNLTVSFLTVHDATYWGIFVDGGGLVPLTTRAITVSITSAIVYDIGDHTGTSFSPTGNQHGVGILFDSGTGSTSHPVYGTIATSTVYKYQKGGIVVNHNSNVSATGNTVTGLGPVNFIAQNGIQYSRGANGTIRQNTVSGNYYTGNVGVLADGTGCVGNCPPGRLYVSVGLLLFDIDPNTIQRGQNDLSNNQRPVAVLTDSALG
jgi:hypothetical protein